MHSNETVVRSLVREWLIEAAEIEKISDQIVSDLESSLSGLESLDSQLAGDLAAAEEEIHSKTESYRKDKEQINETLTALILGGLMSIPTLIKWLSKAVSLLMRGYAKIAKKLGGSKHAESAESLSSVVEETGKKFYEAGHHFIQGLFRKFVKAFLIGSAALADSASAEAMSVWCEGEGSEKVNIIASLLEIATTVVLAVYSVGGTIESIKYAHSLMAGAEGVLSAVKGAHIGEAIGVALARALAYISEAFVRAGISTALINDIMKKVKNFWEQVKAIFIDGLSTVTNAAMAAGLATAISMGTLNATDVSQSDSGIPAVSPI